MESSDILFQTNDVCILNPRSNRGILIQTWSRSKNICREGLLSYNELRKVHPELGLTDRKTDHHDPKHDDLIFFRGPYNSDTTTFQSSYDGNSPEGMIKKYSVPSKESAIALIRIDPEKTFVYSSETRAKGTYSDLQSSRIPMTEYLRRIDGHSKFGYSGNPCSNIITYEKRRFPTPNCTYPWIAGFPIERNSEVVVEVPRIPPEWLVSCDSNGGRRKKNAYKTRRSTRRRRQTKRR